MGHDDDSDDMDTIGRIKTSWRHFRQGIHRCRQLLRPNSTTHVAKLTPVLYILPTIIQPISCIYSILAIELMLRWNQVSDVYAANSTGQLIPLVVSVVGFTDILLNIRKKYRQRRQEHEWETEISATNVNNSDFTNSSRLQHTAHNPDHGLQYLDGRWV
ncbi:hypothetical protein BDV12DRAFT_171715 [Aspergillus spectabilis]